MEYYPNQNHSGGSDLPRPKKQPAKPASGSTPRPKQQNVRKQGASGSHPAGKNRPAGNPPASGRRVYSSDTMQLPPYADDYDTEFEERRTVPPPRNQRMPQQHYSAPPKKQKKRRRRSNPFSRFLRGIVVFAVFLFLLYSAAALFMISRLEKVRGEGRVYPSTASLDASYVTSILLIGTDARDASAERGRSDSMILLSINSRTDTISLTSFMRDAYVEIPGHGHNKLNAAYSFGGADLLMDTLELNYGVRIDDHVTVSFSGFASVIDAFGGVEITLSDAEAQALNEILISEVNALMGDARDADLLESGGTYTLSGKQALCYSRIRYVGNADFERTSRQREVMTQLFSNVKSRLVTAVPELVSSALPNLATNMSTGEMYLLSLRVPLAAGYDIMQLQIPAEGTWSGQTVDGQSVLMVDFEENTALLRDTVYAATKTDETE